MITNANELGDWRRLPRKGRHRLPMTKLSPRQSSEPPLPRARHLRAVGQVTAGIAHDINNALTVVVWKLERLSSSHSASSKEAETVRVAINSAMDAARLLQRLLEYTGQNAYDPALVDLQELLFGMVPVLKALVKVGIGVEKPEPGGVGPVIVDATLLELALLELAVALASSTATDGSITLKAEDLRSDQAPPANAPNARILLSVSCDGMVADRPGPTLEDTLLQHFADRAGGWLTMISGPDRECEVRLYLPRAIGASAEGNIFI
jgi:signal transduction histidine kinase